MTVLRVFLVVYVLVMVGASADASASSRATGTWTLTVTFAGTGTGVVTSSPAGIACTNVGTDIAASNPPQGSCSAQFPDDISPWVIATPSGPVLGSTGSTYTTISCGPETHGGVLDNQCQVGGFADGTAATVEVTFTRRPAPCIVARAVGQPVAQAKRNLRFIGCKVGTVRYVHSSWLQDGDVVSQNPNPHWQRQQGRVNLVVGKGPRGS
jgi:PASTA domain